jgi:hypothetical protein
MQERVGGGLERRQHVSYYAEVPAQARRASGILEIRHMAPEEMLP